MNALNYLKSRITIIAITTIVTIILIIQSIIHLTMKNIFFFLIVAILFVQCDATKKAGDSTVSNNTTNPGPVAEVSDDGGTLDRSIPPTAGPAPEIKIGEYDKFKLDNGMEVIVVTNDKLPRVSFSLQVDVDPMLEGDKAGVVDLTGQMLRRGTKSKSKAELDEEIDFIGANLSTSGRSISASSLSKHQDKLLEVMSDLVLNPNFKKEELDKVKKQTISGLASGKDDPNNISSNVADVLNYSKDHPYGELTTEETVENVSVKDCENYFDTYFKPNTTRLIIVGDVDSKAIKGQLDKYFGDWEEGDVPTHSYENPSLPKAAEVAFVDKPGAVQSVIRITYPIEFKPGSTDAIKASVMNTILGGGSFSARLFQNLREDKAYTYGAYSRLRSNELIGSFSAFASVRNEVSDSAVTAFLYEISRMRDEKVAEDDLNKILNQMTGSFSRSLERPETVARFAKNIEKYNLPKDYYKNYLKNLRAVTVDDIQEMAKKYLHPSNAHILVVGNKDEVAAKLAKFSADGTVSFYDTEGERIEESSSEVPTDLTGKAVVEKYIEAIGGAKAVNSIKSGEMSISMGMMGQKADVSMSFETGKSFQQEMSANGQVMMKQVFDGKTMSNGMQTQTLEGKELESQQAQTYVADEVFYLASKYTFDLKGVEKVNEKDAYKVVISSESGIKLTNYYDKETGLKVRSITSQETPMGAMTITADMKDYKESGGIKYPSTITQKAGPQNIEMNVKSATFKK